VLSNEDNALLTRVGRGTPMGELIRRCWTPACLSEELPEPDCDPIRLRLLGEDLIAFRDSAGKVGVMEEHCPHRGASLFFGRNEEGGLRCLYHGWKIDIAGNILETPCEPAESRMRFHVKHVAYPVVEQGDIVWVYLGPRDAQPAFPNLWWMALPPEKRCVGKVDYDCNFVQAMEGVWDSTHSNVLHSGFQFMGWTPEQIAELPREYGSLPTTPMIEAEETPYGFRAAAFKERKDGRRTVSIRPFVVPFHCLLEDSPHIFVPVDDEHCWLYDVRVNAQHLVSRDASLAYRGERVGVDLTPDHHKLRNQHNNYLQDRQAMREKEEPWSYAGIAWGKPHADMMMTESMGPIWERWREHLGVSDFGVVTLRARLLAAARHFMETGTVAEVDASIDLANIRGVKETIAADADWRDVGAGEAVPGLT
jgi:phthalate 4,5-dioxygenase oxygenase subunit